MHLPLNCHEPGYQTKVFTLCQSLTPISCKQGNYRFLTIELVKLHIDRTKHYSLKLLLNIFIYKTHQILLFLMKKAEKREGNIGYNRAELTRADLTQADLTRGRVDPHSSGNTFPIYLLSRTIAQILRNRDILSTEQFDSNFLQIHFYESRDSLGQNSLPVFP